MITTQQLEVIRGAPPSQVAPQATIRMAQGETLRMTSPIIWSDTRLPFDLTGAQLQFVVRDRRGGDTLISRQYEIVMGVAELVLVIDDTQLIEPHAYPCDVFVKLGSPTFDRYRVLGLSQFVLDEAMVKSDQDVTVPVTQQPLAPGPTGPAGPPGPTGPQGPPGENVPTPVEGDEGKSLIVETVNPDGSYVLDWLDVAGGGVVIGVPVTGGEPLCVLFIDADGNLAIDPTAYRYDESAGYLMLGDANDGGVTVPYCPIAIDRDLDSALGPMFAVHNRRIGGVADTWYLTEGLSRGLHFGMGDTGNALPSFYRSGLGTLFDDQWTIGDVDSVYARFTGNELQVHVPIVRVQTANGAIVSQTFVKSSSVAGRVEQWSAVTDGDPYLISGVAMEDGALGVACRVAQLRNQSLTMKTDGLAACVAGTPACLAAILDGRVTGFYELGIRCGVFESSDPGGTPDAPVIVRV